LDIQGVIQGGRTAGIWELGDDGNAVEMELFEPVPAPALRREAQHVGRFLGRDLSARTRRTRT
jgi:hypothetical protein